MLVRRSARSDAAYSGPDSRLLFTLLLSSSRFCVAKDESLRWCRSCLGCMIGEPTGWVGVWQSLQLEVVWLNSRRVPQLHLILVAGKQGTKNVPNHVRSRPREQPHSH